MSYLVEQLPYCDLLRLSPLTGWFVLSARQVVCSSKGFKGRVLAFQSESSAFFYLPSLPRASGPPDGVQEKKKSQVGRFVHQCSPRLSSKIFTSPRFEVEEKNPKLGNSCTSAPQDLTFSNHLKLAKITNNFQKRPKIDRNCAIDEKLPKKAKNDQKWRKFGAKIVKISTVSP